MISIRLIYRIIYRNFLVWTKFLKPSLVANLGEPLIYLVLMGFGMGKLVHKVNGMRYIDFLAPGLILSSTMYAASFESTISSYTRMITQKTYESIMITPVNLSEIVAGEIIWGMIKGLISSIFFITIMGLMGLIHSWLFLLSLWIVIADGLFFSALSIIFVGIAHSYEFFNYFFTLVLTPLFLFSGIFFPINTLPHLIGKIANYTPLVPMVICVRDLNSGIFNTHTFILSSITGMISIPMAIIAYKLIRKRLIK
ncbi:MAG: ABC transporter permease [Deltaproteobacteria bacterium]|nr:ABC transporter permease [Deltaproteobacteria bacterium]MCL5791974.1 ABC transporter permease [Deltaproteobacteria bacterium]